MKIKFKDNLDYQIEAIEAITNIFEGQETLETNFTVGKIAANTQMNLLQGSQNTDLGIGNKLILDDEDLLSNIQKIQLKHGLPQSKDLNRNNLNFCVEMETGTGKTYVYLRTIMEMNRKYGFKKFIIVVPSIAIKEGTNKSLEITKEHFQGLYDNIIYNSFIYDSQKLEQVRNFATSNNLEIMVINIGSFNKSFEDPSREDKANVIHRYNDRLSGYRPIDFISQTNPVVIIDEPQSVDTTDKSKEAIESLNPLCTLRYSATHRVKENLMYKLDSVDAYDRKLVKGIEVAGIKVPENQNNTYIKVLGITATKTAVSAELELDVRQKSGLKRMSKKIKKGDHLEDITKNPHYEGYFVVDISAIKEDTWIDLSRSKLEVGQVLGGESPDTIKRYQIRKTIEEHLKKEKRLNPMGIKVLSLFFIDKVANYRTHDIDGNTIKGKYAKIFEEEYESLIMSGKYTELGENLTRVVNYIDSVHKGYFSGDKKKTKSGDEFTMEKDTNGTTGADDDAFQVIMKEKERLLSMDEPLRFIFSHSALKEGWDNPNVFQICTLVESGSEIDRRQKVGRGLRICVNQDGERVEDSSLNILTVMANESYKKFAEELQKEISKDTGIIFGIVDSHTFANISVMVGNNNSEYLGEEKSEEIYDYLKEKGYIDTKGQVQDLLKKAINDNKVEVPEEMKDIKHEIVRRLRKIAGSLNIKDADKKQIIKVNKEVVLSEDFKNLWNKIKYKTTFNVDFDSEKLIETCSEALKNQIFFTAEKYKYFKAKTEINKGGVGIVAKSEVEESLADYNQNNYNIPDILSYIQSETSLTRKSIANIIIKSDTEIFLKRNPQRYVDEAIKIIKTTMSHFIIDGIKYEKLENEFYDQKMFKFEEELQVHFKEGMVKSSKSPYDYIVDDSNIEQNIALRFEQSTNVKVYAKLPPWFKINTPLGNYNPDWAVLYEKNGIENLYLVVETKGSLITEELRPKENGKIECGKKHFKAISVDLEFKVANTFDNLEKQL